MTVVLPGAVDTPQRHRARTGTCSVKWSTAVDFSVMFGKIGKLNHSCCHLRLSVHPQIMQNGCVAASLTPNQQQG